MSTVTVLQPHSDVSVTAYESVVALTVAAEDAPRVTMVGEQGPSGASQSTLREHTHQQATPATVWTINHDLGFRPAVYVTDSAGDECEGDVDHLSSNSLTITFSAAFAGTARLS